MRFICCQPAELVFGRGRVQEFGTRVPFVSAQETPAGAARLVPARLSLAAAGMEVDNES